MYKYTLYIGANNETGEVEKSKIKSIISEYYKGFTMVDSLGLWEGVEEPSVIVTIFSSMRVDVMVEDMADTLCTDLNQYAILVEMPDGKGVMVERG